jgi:hypothetical protein
LVRALIEIILFLITCLVGAALTAVALASESRGVGFAPIAFAIFGVAGTFLALAVPTADLSGQLITRQAEYWNQRLTQVRMEQPTETKRLAEIGISLMDEAEARFMPGVRGIIYSFIALLLSTVILFNPGIAFGSTVVRLDAVALGFALAFLFVGAASFIRVALSTFGFSTARDTKEYLTYIRDERRGL